ncbi:MAG: hypothetical protein STSR0008_16570 [Ignavibacterium sp.]
MKQNELKKLSAYIDNELNETDKSLIEEKLQSSQQLKEEYKKSLYVKSLISSIKSLPEDEFFEEKLLQKIYSKKRKKFFHFNGNNFRKPAFIIVGATICLLIFFKFNPTFIRNFIDNQKALAKGELSDLYTKNLRPILYTAGLTNDDLFAFAFQNILPIDKKNNKVIEFGKNENGTNYFEIKEADVGLDKLSLNNFVSTLKLNKNQINQVQSILDGYEDKITTQVLVSENNTYAVNPNILNYASMLQSELLSFAKEANPKVFKNIFPNENHFENYDIKSEKNQNNFNENNYLFITPDTILSTIIEFEQLNRNNKNKSNEQINFSDKYYSDIKVNIKYNASDSNIVKKFKIYKDSNYCKIEIPDYVFPNIKIPNFNLDSILENSFKQFENFSFDFNIDSMKKKDGAVFKFKNRGNDSVNVFEFNVPNTDSLYSPENFENYFKYFNSDSLYSINPKEMQKEMERLRKELDAFRREMEKWQQEFYKRQIQQQSKKPIEI